jgi:non-heme chloroperoxidase
MPSIDSVALSTGVRLPYVELGPPAGVPVLMLHGYTDSWRSFELLLPHLPSRVRAIAVTERGHGDADRPATGYRPEDFVSDVAAFMDALELPAAVLVGHSGGSYTAQRFAIEHPDRTLGIALVGAFRALHGKPELHELWQAVAELRDPVDPDFVREFQESTATQPVPVEFMEAVIAESRKVPARVWQATLKGLLDAEAPTETGTITAPTLILWGDRDTLCTRRDLEALVAAISGARLVVFQGTGHAVHWEQPERAAAELAAFVGTGRDGVGILSPRTAS